MSSFSSTKGTGSDNPGLATREGTGWLYPCTLLILPAFVSVYYVIGPANVWPENHEYVSFLLRTRVFAEHIGMGDLLPVWSTMDNLALGSPFPLLYHKLFYLVSGSLNALGLSEKNAVMLSLIGFLWFGSVGMFMLMTRVGCGRLSAFAGATYFIFANYTVTDWLIRGAVAELAAVALIPWLIWSFFVSLDNQRVVKRLGLFLALIFLSHSVIAFFAMILLAIVGCFAVLGGRLRINWLMLVRSLPAVLVCLLVMLPYAVVMLLMGSAYDMRRLLIESMLPWLQYQSLERYFWDKHWSFGRSWEGFTVQLDLPVLILYGVSLLLLVVRFRMPERKKLTDATLLFLLFAICLLLQMRWTSGFYQHVPGAEFIQFPWRLLAVMTPALIGLAMLTAELASRRFGPWMCIAACVAGIAVSGVFRPIQYGDIADVPDTTVFGHNNVYQPVNAQYRDPHRILEAVAQQECTIASTTQAIDQTTEQSQRQYILSCPSPQRVALPVYSAPGMSVGTDGQLASCVDLEGLSALCAVDADAGETVMTVRFPTLLSMIRSAL